MNKNIIPTLTIILAVGLLILFLTRTIHPAVSFTQDLGRHLKLGELIITTKQVPKTNLFSYTNQNFEFINHHWGSEVLFFLLHKSAGINLLIILKIIILLASFSTVVYSSYKKSSLPFALISATIFLPLFLERTHIRPEIFSFLLFSIVLLILISKTLKSKWLLLLPFLFLLWVNLHIYFAAGLALVTFFILEKIIKKQDIKFHSLLLAACYTIIILNPNGLKGALVPLNIFKSYGYPIVENQTPFFLNRVTGQNITLFLISLPLAIFTIAKSLQEKDYFIFLSSSFFTSLSLKQIRNFPLYALTLIPFSAHYLSLSLPKLKNKNRFVTIALITLISLVTIKIYSQLNSVQYTINNPIKLGVPSYTHQAFTFFKNNNLPGPIFNNFDLAGLAIYHLYPQYQVFVDNRPEAFPPLFFQNTYIPMQQDPQLFTNLQKKYNFQTIVFSHTDITPWAQNFLSSITNNPDWTVIYLDPRAIILVNTQTQPQLSKKFFLNQNNAATKLQNLLNSNNIKDLILLSNFFKLANWPKPQNYALQRINFLAK